MAELSAEGPHCRTCELPKEVCACADAREYDRWWEYQQFRPARRSQKPQSAGTSGEGSSTSQGKETANG